MQSVNIETSKIYPLELPQDLPENSGTFEIWDNGIIMVHMYATNIRDEEVDAFNTEPLKLGYVGNPQNGLNAIYIDCNLGMIENVFNPKLYKDHRVEKFITSGNTPLFFILMENETRIVRSIKMFNMNNSCEAVRNLKDIWRNTMRSDMTNEKYIEWFMTHLWVVEMERLQTIMQPIGIVNIGCVIENLSFIQED